MKILKTFNIILTLAIVVCFTACKKHYAAPSPADQGSKPEVKLTKLGDETNNNQFEYNADGVISRIIIVTDSNPTIYNVSYINHMPSELKSKDFNVKLGFSDSNLQQAEWYNNNNAADLQSKTLFKFAGNNVIEEEFFEKSATGLQPWLKYKFEPLPNGDIDMVEFFLWNSTTGQYTFLGSNRYEYDNHPNPVYPLKSFYVLFGFPATPHNVLKITSYDASSTLVNVTMHNYTYNGLGYPIEVRRASKPTGGFESVTTLKYTYQE